MVDRDRLNEVLVESARALVSRYDVEEMLQRLCDAVAEVVPVTGAGVMLEDEDGHLRFVAASDEPVRRIESLQIELDEGPCLHAYRSGDHVVVPDLEGHPMFPRFAPRAQAVGLRAVYSFPMCHGGDRIGALNLYRSDPGAFEDEDIAAGQALADVAAVYILNARELAQSNRLATQLQRALDSRIVIEQAKGRLAERHGIDMATAFDRLRRTARNEGRRLHEVARDVVSGRDGVDAP